VVIALDAGATTLLESALLGATRPQPASRTGSVFS
jgi:hypothetical protein